MERLLEGKTAIVTGGSRGIGLAVATALGVDGAKVLVVARDEEKVRHAAGVVRTRGGIAEFLRADVTAPGAAEDIVAAALREFGGLDVVVSCAGVFVWRKFLDLDADDWRRSLDTNLSAPFFLTQEAAKAMIDQERGGSIIHIASIHGAVADPHVVAQCASKGGVLALTRSAAEALREHDIRVNAISPGSVDPDSADRRGESPRQKVTQADIANLTVYLASDLSKSITGSVIEAYGSTRSVLKA